VRKGALGPLHSQPKEVQRADNVSAFLPVRMVSSVPRPDSTINPRWEINNSLARLQGRFAG
jgi:hypothetical protein